MSVMPIGMPVAPVMPVDPSTTASATSSVSGGDFGSLLAQGLQDVQRLQSTADEKSVAAATGDLQDVHDYTIAASQASLATELATTLRNKGVEAFNEILRMPL